MTTNKKALTINEILLVVTIITILAVIAVPKLNYAFISKQKADTLAKKIVTDLRRARALAISNAATNTAGFAVNMNGSAPYSDYDIVNLDTSSNVDSHTIDSSVTCNGGSVFQFGPLGNLLAGSDTQLTVSANGKTVTINIISATGTVKCTEN